MVDQFARQAVEPSCGSRTRTQTSAQHVQSPPPPHPQIIPGARKMGYKIQAHAFQGYWEDIGTIEAFYNANLALANPEKNDFRCALGDRRRTRQGCRGADCGWSAEGMPSSV